MVSAMWLIGMTAFVGYSLWLTVSAIRADKAGDTERADELRVRGVLLRLGVGFGVLFLFLALVFITGAIE